jgi:predicted nicotinamide N-methyase
MNRKFDLILAADVMYEQRFFLPLLQTLDSLLLKGGMALITEPQRTIAKKFFAMLDTKSYTHSKHSLVTYYDGSAHPIDLHLLGKNKVQEKV